MERKNPTFTLFKGPMWGGKTSRLLSSLDRLKYQKREIIAFKPTIDDRYASKEIISHSGWKMDAVPITNSRDLFGYLADSSVVYDTIAVDEAFMISGIADALIFLYKSGFDVIVSTLDISANGKPFPEVEKMLSWATHIETCPAVCSMCNRDAFFTHKKNLSDDEIEVGGSELYEPRCMIHHAIISNIA